MAGSAQTVAELQALIDGGTYTNRFSVSFKTWRALKAAEALVVPGDGYGTISANTVAIARQAMAMELAR